MPSDRAAPGPLIGSGRAADIYDLGDGRVLRRNRSGRDTALEAATMEHLLSHGYPVPQVFDTSGPDLVMERIVGRTMLESFAGQPWRLRSYAQLLAQLHQRLAEVPVPQLPLPERFGTVESIVHADLHPDNVMLGPAGPVVIDWPNAGLGPRDADVALSWVIIATSDIDGGRIDVALKRAGRAMFLRSFLAHSDRGSARILLPAAARQRLNDPNVRPREARSIQGLLASEGFEVGWGDPGGSADLGAED